MVSVGKPRSLLIPLAWAAAVGGALVLSNGRWMFPAAAWFAPALLLRFVNSRGPRPGRRLAAGFLIFFAAYCLMWRGLIPAPGILYFAIVFTYACVYFLPFLIHRWLAARISSCVSTLVFPCAWVACELALERLTPFGSWLSAAYTQSHARSLMQIAAITGLPGVSFLLAWFAAVLAWSWERGFEWRRVRAGAVAFCTTLLLVLAFGEARQRLEPERPAEVRIAAMAPRPSLQAALDREVGRVVRQPPTSRDLSGITRMSEALVADLLRRTEQEAIAGAQVVAWSEAAARMLKAQEPEFLDRARGVAAKQGIYLLAGYGVWTPGHRPPFENVVVAIDPRGTVAWRYFKTHPAPGAESSMIAAGDGRLRTLDTPYGRISAVICHDLDFPRLIRQAGQANVGLLIGPSADWSDIFELHANMASARAIENGLTLVRPAWGLSTVTDRLGRRLGSADTTSKGAEDDVSLVTQCPAGGPSTVYARFGDAFAWGATVFLFALALRQWTERWRRPSIFAVRSSGSELGSDPKSRFGPVDLVRNQNLEGVSPKS